MIAAISMMRRRADISLEQFRRHWLDPHGVMTAELPGVRYYIQSHCLDAPGTNALAKELAIEGFPQLWFDSIEARRIAY
ncbi:MAG TPA: EthD family reductase, partial [Hyphomicrobiaceae bacterium]